MSSLVPVVAVVAALVAAEPARPAKPSPVRRISAQDRKAADAYTTESLAWTQELTRRGEKLGNMLADIFTGKTKSDEPVKAELKANTDLMDEKLAHFTSRPTPAFREMVAFRQIMLDYLAWQRPMAEKIVNESLPMVKDDKLPIDERRKRWLGYLMSLDAEERAWKKKIQAAQTALQGVIGAN